MAVRSGALISDTPRLDTVIALLREIAANQRQRAARCVRLSEAAQYIGVSDWQLRRLIRDGEIPTVKAHKGDQHAPIMIDVADLNQFVERRKT
jgi:excisionase family DNA binding protein